MGLANGFTLIEVMMASLVFLSGLAAVLTMQEAAARTRMRGSRLSTARIIAANLEDLSQVLAPAQLQELAQGPARYYDGAGVPLADATQAIYTLTPSVQGQTNTLKLLRLHLAWTYPGTTRQTFLDTDVQVRLP